MVSARPAKAQDDAAAVRSQRVDAGHAEQRPAVDQLGQKLDGVPVGVGEVDEQFRLGRRERIGLGGQFVHLQLDPPPAVLELGGATVVKHRSIPFAP